MRDKNQEMSRNLVLSVFTLSGFFVLGLVCFYNTYNIYLLEQELLALKVERAIYKSPSLVEGLHSMQSDEIQVAHNLSTQSTTRKKRNIQSTGMGRSKPLPSIHLNGDTSNYILGTHTNFNGNGHLRHLHEVFVDWRLSHWVEKTDMLSHFGYHSGYLTIKEPGLYLVYAQIYYLDVHDQNGYKVFKNSEGILQCTVQIHSRNQKLKGNTCFTMGVEHMSRGDRISIKDITQDHYSCFQPGKSFFGAVKLGDFEIESNREF
ncbi:uncharacterized protein LOC126749159 [Anthonomus grandis grandis]|uniref:uncharacterized protein LOC126749159 n=1 Tax=Anthonomus grandis grandis TaxID=2921223 RepID=UPI0021664780|nr:uncharacterized protein LOC126749159 [Anthonomus grandis grandis]